MEKIGKTKTQTSNRDIKYFHCLDMGHTTLQCPIKRTMIIHMNAEMETKSESEDYKMPPLEDASDEDSTYSRVRHFAS